jgi:hypothetical protein
MAEKYGLERTDAAVRARQQRDLDKASKMMEEDRDPKVKNKYTAEQLGKRMEFMTDALRQARIQREIDFEAQDRPKREAAAELQRETRGVRPTPKKDRADMATHNYYKGFDKPLFGGKEGLPVPGMKKGGKVSSASARADGIAQRGKTRGRMV